jgi:alpha-beta hydrolase superfamily lysophospholipase
MPASSQLLSEVEHKMKTREWKWTSHDGLEMYAQSWEPDEDPKAVVCLVHGLGEHSGRYAHAGKAFTEAGFALAGFDLRGHGKSGGPRGHTSSYEALMDDIGKFIGLIANDYSQLPRFLYGHSLGGNQVINFALRRNSELLGVIATGPWLELAFQPPPSKVMLGKIMNTIFPGFAQASGLETSALSHDAEVVKAYENDPLVHDRISARLFVNTFDTGLWALNHAEEIPMPLLLMHGGADRITSPEASRQFAESAGEKVTLRIWDDLYHEIHNEPEKGEVFEFMIDWMNSQLKKK